MKSPKIIYVIDDDPRVLRAIEHLLSAANFVVETYTSAARFLRHYNPASAHCVICDLAMPRMDGLGLQRELAARGGRSQIIFLSGQDSVPRSIVAMKQGAFDFLTKPVSDRLLLESVTTAFVRDAQRREGEQRLALLTDRELEILRHIINGQLNKQIADRCRVTVRTVKFHRANLVKKLGIASTAQMTRLGLQTGLLRVETFLTPATAQLRVRKHS